MFSSLCHWDFKQFKSFPLFSCYKHGKGTAKKKCSTLPQQQAASNVLTAGASDTAHRESENRKSNMALVPKSACKKCQTVCVSPRSLVRRSNSLFSNPGTSHLQSLNIMFWSFLFGVVLVLLRIRIYLLGYLPFHVPNTYITKHQPVNSLTGFCGETTLI